MAYRPAELTGRDAERRVLDRLVEAVRAGESRALVLRGEPGVGKTALLDYLAERASGCRVARAAGVQSEMELAFAALHQLCGSMLDRLECLPAPQRDALRTVFGLSSGSAPDRFLVGLAALSLLAEVAEEQPLVCLVDDAQWLDRASVEALAFVARRLGAESVALILAVRQSGEVRLLSGLPELVVEGLGDGDARALLGSVIRGPLDERVRDRIVAETRGNPLALLELPRGLTPPELAGGFGLLPARELAGRIQDSFRRRLGPLPAETRRLLLVAAVEPVGEPALVWRAAKRLGIFAEAADAAEAEGLLKIGARVRFRHPLVRSAVYQAASRQERREAHRVLAEATDPEIDPDRRAWHRAQATAGPDEDVAADLERSAGRAQARGGLAAAAAFLERAAALTLDPARQAERALAAAQAMHQAGAPDRASELLATAELGRLSQLQRARVDLLRGQIAFAAGRGSDAPPLLLKAAERLEPLDLRLARETYQDAFAATFFAGRLASGGIREVAEAVRAAPSAQPPRSSDLLLDGLALLITEGYATAAPALKRALRAFRSQDLSRDEEIRWLWLAGDAATHVWDDESWHTFTSRQVRLAREAGALSELPIALVSRIGLHVLAGEFSQAGSLLEDARAFTEATGRHLALYSALWLAAWRGRDAEVSELIEGTIREVVARGGGLGLAVIHCANAVLCNGLGRYEDALRAAERAVEYPHDSYWALSELVEAATRSGETEPAGDALQRLSTMTRAGGSDWGLGIEARSRALVSHGQAAERLYREAIDRLGRTRMRPELARAHLLYGEWLRRQRRPSDARQQLHTAHDLLAGIGMEGFAERARRELRATGERVRRRTVAAGGALTAQEAQVARLARAGLSNPEIGTRLFLSAHTVQYHLRKVFAKLGITSRSQLDGVLPATPASAERTR